MQDVERIAEEYARDCAADAVDWAGEERGDDTEPACLDSIVEVAWEDLAQRIDGCQEVIYTWRAWEVVGEDPDAAEQAHEDMTGEAWPSGAESLAQVMSALAYARLYQAGGEYIAGAVAEYAEDRGLPVE